MYPLNRPRWINKSRPTLERLLLIHLGHLPETYHVSNATAPRHKHDISLKSALVQRQLRECNIGLRDLYKPTKTPL